MDQHFKMERAEEEILRLNVEIRRFATYIHDEEAFLLEQETVLSEKQPLLAGQLRMRRLRLTRSNDQHIKRLCKLTSLQGFTGSIIPGTSIEAARAGKASPTDAPGTRGVARTQLEAEEDEEDENAGQEAGDAACKVIELACI